MMGRTGQCGHTVRQGGWLIDAGCGAIDQPQVVDWVWAGQTCPRLHAYPAVSLASLTRL